MPTLNRKIIQSFHFRQKGHFKETECDETKFDYLDLC